MAPRKSLSNKDALRHKVWQVLEEKGIARFPGARGRIPNFSGAERCAQTISSSPLWQKARVIKANPDSPQRAIRQKALEEGKILYMAVPRLSSEKPFIELDPKRLPCSAFAASTIKGAAKHGRPVSLGEMRKIELIVCGSVAVNIRGARLGKGGGYSDLEYALLREEGKVDAETPIVTTAHALQIVDQEIPMTEHDIPVDHVFTPAEVITPVPQYPKPQGIHWKQLEQEKIEAIPVLRSREKRPRA
jgi:5-formyltetrahydrofolate cyclo-ligase